MDKVQIYIAVMFFVQTFAGWTYMYLDKDSYRDHEIVLLKRGFSFFLLTVPMFARVMGWF